jgi:hypothetical protein
MPTDSPFPWLEGVPNQQGLLAAAMAVREDPLALRG